MPLYLLIISLGVPALLYGYRCYKTNRGFDWAKRTYLYLLLIAVFGYLGWGILDTIAQSVFGVPKGLLFNGPIALTFCFIFLALTGFGLMFGYILAVIQRAYQERNWKRLKDMFR